MGAPCIAKLITVYYDDARRHHHQNRVNLDFSDSRDRFSLYTVFFWWKLFTPGFLRKPFELKPPSYSTKRPTYDTKYSHTIPFLNIYKKTHIYCLVAGLTSAARFSGGTIFMDWAEHTQIPVVSCFLPTIFCKVADTCN